MFINNILLVAENSYRLITNMRRNQEGKKDGLGIQLNGTAFAYQSARP